MPRMVFFSLLLSLLTSCLEGVDQTYQPIERQRVALTSFSPIVNAKELKTKEDVDFNEDTSIQNRDYPVEIWLYSNNKYYYDLPNLGEGIGSWTYKDGYLTLENNHHIKAIDLKIDMNYELYFAKENQMKLSFSDRFGGKILDLEIH